MLFFAVGCVDNSIDLQFVEGDIGVSAEQLNIPLGYLKSKTLSDILGELPDNIVIDPHTGNYMISYAGEPQSFVVDGSNDVFTVPEARYDVDINYPAFSLPNSACIIDDSYTIGGSYHGVEIVTGMAFDVPSGIVVSGSEHGSAGYNIDINMPEYVERIDKVYIEHDAKYPGAPIKAIFSLGSLATVSGGGTVSVEMELPEGYTIFGEDMAPIEGNVFRVLDRPFGAGEHDVEFTVYVSSVINHESAQGGVIHIPNELNYNISYTLTTTSGNVAVDELPSLALKAELECKDAEVSLAPMSLIDKPIHLENTIVLDVLNDSVKGVQSVDFSQGNINLSIQGMEWLTPEALAAGAADDVEIVVVLPKSVVLSTESGVDFDSHTNTLKASLAQLMHGVSLKVDRLDFGEGLMVEAHRNILVDLPLEVSVNLVEGARIRLGYLQHQGGVQLKVGYDAIEFTVERINGFVDYQYTDLVHVDIDGLGQDGSIELQNAGLQPIVDFSLTSSLTLPVNALAKIIPSYDGKPNSANSITIPPFTIAAAQVDEHFTTVTPTTTIVRIGKNLEAESGVTNVECDLSKLFEGALPQGFDIEFQAKTNPEQLTSLVLMPEYEIAYQYGFEVPLNFGGNFRLKYTDVVEDLSQTFSELSESLAVVGEVLLFADVTTTLPFNLSLELEMMNNNGKATNVILEPVDNSAILGSEDGATEKNSTLCYRVLTKDDTDIIAALAAVDSMRYTIAATSTKAGASLNDNQKISAQFALQVDGYVNIKLTSKDK